MSSPAKSVFVWSFYLFVFGIGFLFIPNPAITLLGFEPTNDIWIRFFGLLAIVLGTYYFTAARKEDLIFFRSSVTGRLIFVTGEFAFVLVHMTKPVVAVFAIVELASAIWTHLALMALKKSK